MSDSISTLFASNTHTASRRAQLTKLLAARMIQGYVVLPQKCAWCDLPLMEFRGSVMCVACMESPPQQQEQEQESQLGEGDEQEGVDRGVERSDVSTKTNATEDSIEIMLHDKGVKKEQKNSKNALFMAAIAGLAQEARRRRLEEDERQETDNNRIEELSNQRENNEEMTDNRELKDGKNVPPPPPNLASTLAPSALNQPSSPVNHSSKMEVPHETGTKDEPEPTVGSGARGGIDVTPLPPLSPPTNDIPEIKSSSLQLKPVFSNLASKTNAISSPPRPRAAIRYPSPNLTTRKMMTINNLTKEPQNLKAASYREKTYIMPSRDRSKNIMFTDKSCDDNTRVDNKDEKEKAQEESPTEQKNTTQPTDSNPHDNGFFQELKHRAALQNATHALLNAEHAAPKHSKQDPLDSVVLQSCHDEISALGSQSSYESEVPSKASVAKPNSSEKATLPMEAATKPVIAPPNAPVDVLPDDEKKDIAIECMKEFRAPLPFDEGSAKSGLVEEDVADTSDVDDYKSVRSTPTVLSTHIGGASVLEETTLEEAVEHRLFAEEMDGYHSVQNPGRDDNENLLSGSTTQEYTPQSEEKDCDDSVKSLPSDKVETKQVDDHSSVAKATIAKTDDVELPVEAVGRSSGTAELDTQSNVQSKSTVESYDKPPTEICSTVEAAESSSDPVEVPDNGPNLAAQDLSLRQPPLVAECSNAVVTDVNSTVKAVKCSLNDVESHMFTTGKSLRSLKSSLKYAGGANFDEDRSLKSMPATSSHGSVRRDFREELEEFKSKIRMAALMEGKGKEVVTRNISLDLTQNMAEQSKEIETNEHQEEEGTCTISIKEIKVSSTRGDASTALASISSKMEHQTRRLAQLEAEALRKHKEAEIAAIKAREALEKMLDARSKPKETNVASTGEKIKHADLSMCSTQGSRLESTKKTPAIGEGIKTGEKECPSLASRSKYSSKHSSDKSEKIADSQRKQEEAKCEALHERDDRADLSMCSTLSEDSGLKFDKPGPTRDVPAKDYEKEFTSVASRPSRISVAGNDVPDELSFARKKMSEAKNVLPDRNVKQTILSGAPRLSRPKKHVPSLRHSYSDASFSQYSSSYAESSCKSSEAGSTRELASVSSNGSSTHDSSTEGRYYEVSETRRKHQNVPHRTSEERRSSSKGRYRDRSPLSTQRSKSSSPVEVMTRKKSVLLPSLLSPDPPSRPENRSHRVANDRTTRRSHSLPRNKSARSKSKDYGKMSAKTDLLMSKTNNPKKPNHLLNYSSRRGSNVKTDTKTSVPSGISPEVRQPIIARSTSAPQKQSDHLFSGKQADSRQPSFSSPISLANYTSRDGASSARPQIGMPNPEKKFLPHEQAQRLSGNSPNTQHHLSSRHVLPGPMSLSRPTYADREETTLFPNSKFDSFGERARIPAIQLGNSSFHQYVPGQSLTPKSINEHEHFGFKSASVGPYPVSRNVDSIALASHTTFGERMSQVRTHHHPVMNFSDTAGMQTPLMMSSGTVRAPYSSGRADFIREEGTHFVKPHEHKAETVGMHTPLMMSSGTVGAPYSSGQAEYLNKEGTHFIKPHERKAETVGMHTPLMMSSGTVRPPYSGGHAEYVREEGMHYAKPHERKAETVGIHTPLMMSSGTVRPHYSSGHLEYVREEGMHYAKPQEHKVRFVDPHIRGPEIGVDMSQESHQHYSMPYGRHSGY